MPIDKWGFLLKLGQDIQSHRPRPEFAFPKNEQVIRFGDADNIDRFDAYRIYEGLEFMKFSEMPLAEQIAFTDKRISKLKQFREYPYGTKTADKMWHEKVDFQLEYFNRLKNQLESSSIASV